MREIALAALLIGAAFLGGAFVSRSWIPMGSGMASSRSDLTMDLRSPLSI